MRPPRAVWPVALLGVALLCGCSLTGDDPSPLERKLHDRFDRLNTNGDELDRQDRERFDLQSESELRRGRR